jgi:hypothetical protein
LSLDIDSFLMVARLAFNDDLIVVAVIGVHCGLLLSFVGSDHSDKEYQEDCHKCNLGEVECCKPSK